MGESRSPMCPRNREYPRFRAVSGMTAVSADFDDDGWPDIFVACDSTPSVLYKNQHDGTFTDIGLEAGVAVNEDGREQAGMGFMDDTPVLYAGVGNGIFEDTTSKAGLGEFTRYVGWGAGFADFDNDGWQDLFWVNGNVYPEIEKAFPQYKHANPRILLRNLGNGRFADGR